MSKKPLFDDDELFYFNENGFMVFTADYLLARGYCCGNGCKHCPFEYKNVENESLRKKLMTAQEAKDEGHNKK
jgi:2-iminoacetate synthase ThiH